MLFFYPAAMTPGCTKEACHFRDLARRVRGRGRHAGGHQHRRGGQAGQVRRLADVSTTRCSPTPTARSPPQFGVKRGLLGKFLPVKRTTFVIDTDRTVLEVISSEVNMDTHADKALDVLRARKTA